MSSRKDNNDAARRLTRPAGFNIGITAHPTEGIDAENELRMAKSALLYADHVYVYSPKCALIRHISSLGQVPEQHATRLALEILYHTDGSPLQGREDARAKLEEFILGPDIKKGLTRKSIKLWNGQRHLRDVVAKSAEKFRDQCQRWVSSHAFVELREAENAGALTFNLGSFSQMSAYEYLADVSVQAAVSKKRLGSEARDQQMMTAMAELLFDAVVGVSQYPLLDKESRSLIRASAATGHLYPSVTAKQGGKMAGLGDTLLRLLPTCDLPMNEVLGVREELRSLSSQFHGALCKASDRIEALQWEHGFDEETRLVVDTFVAPALAEIEAAIAHDNTLRKVFSFSKDAAMGAGAGGGVWVFLEDVVHMAPLIAAGVASSAALATLVATRLLEKQSSSESIRKKEWFFYYEARQRVESS